MDNSYFEHLNAFLDEVSAFFKDLRSALFKSIENAPCIDCTSQDNKD